MNIVTIEIDSFNHYKVVRIGDNVLEWKLQLWEYGPDCPHMGYGQEFTEGELIATLPLPMGEPMWVIWQCVCDIAGNYITKLYMSDLGDWEHHPRDKIICGDDFIHFAERIVDHTSWKLWVDDQLDDPAQEWRHVPEGYYGASSVTEACNLVWAMGKPPAFMDLDCDLGDGGKVQDFLKFLFQEYPDNPPQWKIHSKNLVAAENADSYMQSWHKSLK